MDGRGRFGSSTTSSEITGLAIGARLLLQPLVLLKQAAVQLRLRTAFDVARGLCRTLAQARLHRCQLFLGFLQLPSRGTLAQAIDLLLGLSQLRLCVGK